MPAIRYLPKKISELDPKTDGRVSILGKVIELGDNNFILDDQTGKIEITFDGVVEPNKVIRAFCSVIEEKMKADSIQQLDNFDLELFYKVKELYTKSGV